MGNKAKAFHTYVTCHLVYVGLWFAFQVIFHALYKWQHSSVVVLMFAQHTSVDHVAAAFFWTVLAVKVYCFSEFINLKSAESISILLLHKLFSLTSALPNGIKLSCIISFIVS